MRLSLHDKENLGKKYVDEPNLWVKTENLVREALVDGKINFACLDKDLMIFFVPSIPTSVIFLSFSLLDSVFVYATSVIPAK